MALISSDDYSDCKLLNIPSKFSILLCKIGHDRPKHKSIGARGYSYRPLRFWISTLSETDTLIMPKNKGKGGKNRKRGKNEADDEKRELVFKEDGQEYAQVLRMLGNGRCEATCIDGTKRLCHIRGKMHKKVWIAAGDIILVGLRDYQDDKADVILKYMADEARLLRAYGELPESIRLNEGIAGGLEDEEEGGADDYIEFEDEDIDKI
ncbi:hypothetical protein L6164_029067 [Bauhinia variegata]|uniref:Uncharacterized protein n=2 Tax=Bauhinia variegata TaxID=167791 RepID=A0ACB9L834_BAUVA|nr:hypothetical protein L6164_029067 [Bauhinia variegata]